MSWTYDGSPGSDTATGRRDAVRLYIGDTDSTNPLVTDQEIEFALESRSDNLYGASAELLRALASKYARRANTRFEGVSIDYGKIAAEFRAQALRAEAEALRNGGLGAPIASGISISDMTSVDDDSDRVDSAFKRGQFRNPPDTGGDDETRADYLS